MNVVLVFFSCIVFASCTIGDSYLVGKKRDPYWAHRPNGRSNTRRSYSSSNNRINNSYKLNNRYANSLDNNLVDDVMVKKFFHGNGNSYQFNYPYFDRQKGNRDSFEWEYPSMEFIDKVKMPKLPPMPSMPKPPQNSFEWPDYIPPIRMIKLPLDTPPAALN